MMGFFACEMLYRNRAVVARGRVVEEVLEVIAGGVDVGAALEEHHAHAGIGIRRLERVGHGLVHRGGNRVLFGGAIEGDGQYAAFTADGDVAHVVCFPCASCAFSQLSTMGQRRSRLLGLKNPKCPTRLCPMLAGSITR